MTGLKRFSVRQWMVAGCMLLLGCAVTIAPWRLVAEESKPAAAEKPVDGAAPQAETGRAALGNRTARQALERLRELGAHATTSRQVELGSDWKGTVADLTLMDDLADFETVAFDANYVDVATVAGLEIERPIEHLILQNASDSFVTRLQRLPHAGKLSLVNHALSIRGFRRVAELAEGTERLSIQSAAFGTSPICDAALKYICQIRSLQELEIDRGGITSKGFSYFRNLDQLETLTFHQGDGFSGPAYTEFAPIKSLRHLSFSGSTDTGSLRALGKLTQLESVRLLPRTVSNEDLAPDVMEALQNLTNVRSFEISAIQRDNQGKKGAIGMALVVAHMPALRSLTLRGPYTSAGGLEALEKLPLLEELVLEPVAISDRSLAAIGRMKELKRLSLGSDGMVTAAAMEKLATITQLGELTLSADSQLTGNDLAGLANLKQLKSLTLAGTPFGDDQIEALRQMTGLQQLNLNKTKITDRSLETIAGLANLRHLSVNGTAVTIAGLLKAMPKLTHLAQLSIDEISVSDRELDQLFAAQPQVQSVGYSPYPGGTTWRNR